MGPVEQTLRHAQEYLERGHCVGVCARDADGLAINPSSPHAVRWCATGAVFAVAPSVALAATNVLGCAAERIAGVASAAYLNDHHAELVPDLYSEAIEAAAELGL